MAPRRGEADPRDTLLEQLCFYRGLYARRGRADRDAVLSIAAAVDYGELLLRVRRVREERNLRRNARPTA